MFNGKVVADSDQTEVVEGNHYFPPDSVNFELLKRTDTQTFCPWKGHANYYSVEVDGKVATDGAWVYESPKQAAETIKGYIAFWNGVTVG